MTSSRHLVPVDRGEDVPAADRLWSEQQKEAIRKQLVPGGARVTDADLALFGEVCARTGLDCFVRQIYLIVTREGPRIHIGIDGHRLIAARAGLDSTDGPYWCAEDGVWRDVWLADEPPMAAKYGVRRTGSRGFIYAVALYREFKGQGPNWTEKPAHMLALCFDEETDVLTDQGFQRFAEVTGRVLQVTDRGLEPTEAEPFVQPWDGAMVTLENRELDFCVTPNHRMVTTAGIVDAQTLFEQARARARHRIPRCVSGTRPDLPITDTAIALAAAYLADGADTEHNTFRIRVSRPEKIAFLEGLGAHTALHEHKAAGKRSRGPGRVVVTRLDQVAFSYPYELIGGLCAKGKRVHFPTVVGLSRRQARLFVDTLIALDGHVSREGARRFYSSFPQILDAFELASVVAGYSVSQRRGRISDIGTRPNIALVVSDRSEIPVVRWGRAYHTSGHPGAQERTGLRLTQNRSGLVWCVTVPSGVIVVRRHGFSMLCGNCAERHALRKAFQQEFAGVAGTVRDHGGALVGDGQEEPELEGWDAPPEHRIDGETGEILFADSGIRENPDGPSGPPTVEEARARFREAVPRAQELKLPFEVPSRSADAREWLEAAVALEERIAEIVRRRARASRGG